MQVYKNLSTEEVVENVAALSKDWQDCFALPSSFEFDGNQLKFINDVDREEKVVEFDRVSLGQMYARLSGRSDNADVITQTRAKSVPQFMWDNQTIAPNMQKVVLGYTHRGLDNRYMLRVKSGTLRAFLSDKYTPVEPNFLTSLFLSTPHIRIPNITLSETEMKINLLTKEYQDNKNLGAGLSLLFDQVGLRSIEIAGMVKRFSCDNSLRVETPMRFYHTKNVILSIIERIGEHNTQLEQADTLMQQYTAAADTVFSDEDFNNLLATYQKRMKFSDEFEAAFMTGIEDRKSLQGIVDGFTQAAHVVYPKDLQRQNAFEEFATELLTQNF